MALTAEDICERYCALTGARFCAIVRANDPYEAFTLLGDPAAHGLRLRFVAAIEEAGVRVADIRALSAQACELGDCLVVDNSVPSAFGCNPLSCGAPFCFERLASGFAVVAVGKPRGKRAGQDDLLPRAHAYLQAASSRPALAPSEADALVCYLDTLAARMQRRFDNARALAEYLAANEHVARVSYPGLEDHPDHQVAAATLLHGFGPLVEFEPHSGAELQPLIAAFAPEGESRGATRAVLTGQDGAASVRLWAGEDSPLAVIDRIDPILRA